MALVRRSVMSNGIKVTYEEEAPAEHVTRVTYAPAPVRVAMTAAEAYPYANNPISVMTPRTDAPRYNTYSKAMYQDRVVSVKTLGWSGYDTAEKEFRNVTQEFANWMKMPGAPGRGSIYISESLDVPQSGAHQWKLVSIKNQMANPPPIRRGPAPIKRFRKW